MGVSIRILLFWRNMKEKMKGSSEVGASLHCQFSHRPTQYFDVSNQFYCVVSNNSEQWLQFFKAWIREALQL